jgi:hypothetical protein
MNILKEEDSWQAKKLNDKKAPMEDIYRAILSIKNLSDKVIDKILPIVEAGLLSEPYSLKTTIGHLINYQESLENKSYSGKTAEYYLENKMVLLAEFLMESKSIREHLFKDIFTVEYDRAKEVKTNSIEELIVAFCKAIINKQSNEDRVVVELKSKQWSEDETLYL